jgi:hypothetical protein
MKKENRMIYKIFFWMMIIGFLGVSIQNPSLKQKMIGLLLAVVNMIIFWE